MIKRSVIDQVDFGVDRRPHATIKIENVKISGLLDSGASISCLGRGAVEFIESNNLKIKKLNCAVNTADGAPQEIIGYTDVSVTFNNESKPIRLYLVPSLSQELYLGVDFWDTFGIWPKNIDRRHGPFVSELSDPLIHRLSVQQQRQLQGAIDCLPSYEIEGLGRTPLLSHSIKTGDATPVKQRFYPVSPAIQNEMYSELDRMLALGVIEVSSSPWNSPMVLVRKHCGKPRLCLDSRAVNKVTVKDAYPLPIIDGIISRLEKTYYISSIDLKDAFWQIPLDIESREKTAFTVPGRPLYQFARMPFGLCNAAQTMCRLMDRVIGQELRESVFVYIDDLLIVSADFDSHVTTIQGVAKRLRDANLTINVSKSKFAMREVKYLGFIVGNGCLMTDPDKVSAIRDFPQPRTIRQLRRFLGLTGWYQRFIKNYSTLASPLTDLKGTAKAFKWNDQAQIAFDSLKACLVSAPVLVHPDFTKPFIIQCDASATGVGSVLCQVGKDGEEHPIAYFSKKLNAAQRNYSVTELECYAAVLSVKKFRPYVEGMNFKIITDHASLKWLMGQKDLSGRLARWSLKLQCFDFTIEHRKGTANVVPDALSRVHMEELSAHAIAIDLNSAEFISEDYLALIDRVRTNQERLPDLAVKNSKVYCRVKSSNNLVVDSVEWKLWVPSELTQDLIARAHNPPLSSHGGLVKTLDRLKQSFYWPKMASQVHDFVSKCDLCKETKAPNVTLRPLMGQQFEVSMPWQRLYLDLLGPYPRSKAGNVSLLIVLDQFSKFVLLKPLRKADSNSIIKFVENEVFHLFGVAESVLTDNGVQFLSKDFKAFLEKNGTAHVTTATHSPQANASERVNRSILSAIRAYITDDHRNWDLNISSIACALRTAVHESTGFSPYFAVFNRQQVQHGSTYTLLADLKAMNQSNLSVLPSSDYNAILCSQIQDRLRRAHKKHESSYNMRSKPVSFRPGQEVFRRNFVQSDFAKNFNAKLSKKFVKCRIVRKLGSVLYELEDMSGKPIPYKYHAKDLRQ